ncbi:MAG: ISAzo13 family transposase, partial [Solimonas sp.]
MQGTSALRQIKLRFRSLGPLMDERMRRQWAAAEAQTYGRGGLSAVSNAIGMSRNTIRKGIAELAVRKKNPRAPEGSRLRKVGGGRKRLTESDPGLLDALEQLVEPTSRGDPMSPLRWTCKSTVRLAEALTQQAHPVGAWTVGNLLKDAGYSLQSNRKTKEGASHPDRNAQFEHINATVRRFQQRGQPVISVDTKKKELVGSFKNGGREWQPQGEPEQVLVHDFIDEDLGKVIPYGVFDLSQNEGWVSVGIDHD